MRTFAALTIVSGLLMACSGDSPTSLQDTPLEMATVAKASYSGFVAPLRGSVRTADEWAGTWQTLYSGQSPVPLLPAIDFSREMVVVAAIGTRSNGCFAVDVTAASLRANGAAVFEVEETVPGPNCVCTQALTQPVHLVKVGRFAGPETFVERKVQSNC